MAVWTFETLDQVSRDGVPDANALVERTGCDVLGVWGDGDGGDAVFDAEREHVLPCFDVPKADGAVTGAGSDSAAIAGEV